MCEAAFYVCNLSETNEYTDEERYVYSQILHTGGSTEGRTVISYFSIQVCPDVGDVSQSYLKV